MFEISIILFLYALGLLPALILMRSTKSHFLAWVAAPLMSFFLIILGEISQSFGGL